ncbi:hypothetical protein B0H13DRAFT_247671 [Mycena leptocephala]|nr:hypothetical protein B0H13DRAFT_247671 [Mycena leptocephala]
MQPLSLDNTSVPKADNPVHDQYSACSHTSNPATLLHVSPSEASDVEMKLSTEILTYQNLISFLNARRPDDKLPLTLDHCQILKSSDSIVDAIVYSLECRKRLLEISTIELGLENDPGLREALRADEAHIATLLACVFDSRSEEEVALKLKGDAARCFIDVVQHVGSLHHLYCPHIIITSV